MFYLLSRVLSLTCAFLYPAYASYKTLSKRPASEVDLERWLMYWSVLGVILSAEYVAEWLVQWIPFYWVLKSLLLMYLALPQTQGSTVIYRRHLEPFLDEHEDEIDSTIVELKARVFTYLQVKLRALWEALYSALLNQAQSQSTAGVDGTNPATAGPSSTIPVDGQPPTLADPVSGATRMAWGLWHTYGPSIVAKGTALVAAASAASANQALNANASRRSGQGYGREVTGYEIPAHATQGASASTSTSTSTSRTSTLDQSRHPSDTSSVLERRRQLEAELAALPLSSAEPALTPTANNAYTPRSPGIDEPSQPTMRRVASRSSSSPTASDDESITSTNVLEGLTTVGAPSVYLTATPDGTGNYEDISREDVEREGSTTPPANWGWFGWGRSNSGYERVKND